MDIKKYGAIMWTGLDSTDLGQCQMASSCEHGNELQCCTKDGEFLEQLSDFQLLEDSTPWCLLIDKNDYTFNPRSYFDYAIDTVLSLPCLQSSFEIHFFPASQYQRMVTAI